MNKACLDVCEWWWAAQCRPAGALLLPGPQALHLHPTG